MGQLSDVQGFAISYFSFAAKVCLFYFFKTGNMIKISITSVARFAVLGML